jgi:hypothetical protein
MERARKVMPFVAGTAKVIGVIAALFSIVAALFAVLAGSARLYAYGSTRASASEVAVIKSNQDRDHELWMYIASRVGAIGDQMNNLAIHGRVNYVEPPIPPTPAEVLGPQLSPKGNANR